MDPECFIADLTFENIPDPDRDLNIKMGQQKTCKVF
jgi:hypothetical protein